MSRAVGDTVGFSAQPYYYGTGKIVEMTKNTDHIGGWHVELEVIEGTRSNRLFNYTSHTPMQAGERMELNRVFNINADVLIYVYPV